MTGRNGIEFFKKVGVVAGAALAVVALGNTLGGFAVRQLVLPAIREVVAEEREARVKADVELSAAILQLSQDRLMILTILEYPPGPQRAAEIRRVREAWSNKRGGR